MPLSWSRASSPRWPATSGWRRRRRRPISTPPWPPTPSAAIVPERRSAMLGTLYGATSGDAAPVLGVLRRRFPTAVSYVEAAARDGEAGRLVRSRLGRTCPPPSSVLARGAGTGVAAGSWGAGAVEARQTARDRGRFTRNFVVQASAADWTAVMLAALRRRLRRGRRAGRRDRVLPARRGRPALPDGRRSRGCPSASRSPRRRRPDCCSGRRPSASPSRARSSHATPTPSSTAHSVHCGPTSSTRNVARWRRSALLAGMTQSYAEPSGAANRCPQATPSSTDQRFGLPAAAR